MNINNIIENISISHIISVIMLLIIDTNYNYISLILKLGFISSGLTIIYSNNYKFYIFNYTIFLFFQLLTLINKNIYQLLLKLLTLIINVISIKLIIKYKKLNE